MSLAGLAARTSPQYHELSMTTAEESAKPADPMEPYLNALKLMGLGMVLVVLAVGIALYQLGRSNRPHELTMIPVVAGLTAINAVLCWRSWRHLKRAWPDRHTAPNRGFRYMVFPLGVGYTLISATVLVVSVGTLIEFLRA